MQKKATVKGYLKTTANVTPSNPLHTQLSLILTDFQPNSNDQGVPITEKENIMRSALYTPLKINFVKDDYEGHDQAIAIGPITHVYEGKDEDRDVIYGQAVIWDEYHEDISNHLKEIFSEGIGTSWEIYYSNSEKDDNGVEWIHGCVFAGTCIVSTPAYGPSRTRVLAIAEKLREINTLGDTTKVESVQTENNVENTEQAATAADNVENTRDALYNAEDILMQIWDGLYGLHSRLYEIEAEKNVNDVASIAEKFSDMITSIVSAIDGLKTSKAELISDCDTLRAELSVFKDQQAQAEKINKQNQLRASLKDAGVDFDDQQWEQRVATYESMTDEAFELYVADLQAVRSNSAKAEKTVIRLPEPFAQLPTKTITAKDIANNWKQVINRD